jgi:predicted nucleic acid-binding protein
VDTAVYLFDTNVVSELRKGERANPGVTALCRDLDARGDRVYLSASVLGLAVYQSGGGGRSTWPKRGWKSANCPRR